MIDAFARAARALGLDVLFGALAQARRCADAGCVHCRSDVTRYTAAIAAHVTADACPSRDANVVDRRDR